MQIFNFHIDSLGGGWLEINDVIIRAVGIADQISNHSKHFCDRTFLDQQTDARLFLDSYRKRYGEPRINHHTDESDSVIRLYPDFKPSRLCTKTTIRPWRKVA